jgi:hypothetical protein
MSDKVANRIAQSMTNLLGADYSEGSMDSGADGKLQRDRLNHRLAALEMRRQSNIEAIMSMAFAVSGDDEVGDEDRTLNDDWLAHLVSHGQDVGNPVMQTVWGQVLSHEAATPGNFSLRTLDALAGMTGDDWGTLKRASVLCFPTGYLLKLGQRADFDEFGVTETDIRRLQALDLIQETDDLSVTFYAPSRGLTFDFPGADLIVRHPDNTLFTLPAYRITGVATEMLAHLGSEAADLDYLQALGESLRRDGYDFRLRYEA